MVGSISRPAESVMCRAFIADELTTGAPGKMSGDVELGSPTRLITKSILAKFSRSVRQVSFVSTTRRLLLNRSGHSVGIVKPLSRFALAMTISLGGTKTTVEF